MKGRTYSLFFKKGESCLLALLYLKNTSDISLSRFSPASQASSYHLFLCVMKYHDAPAFCWGPVCTSETIDSPSPSYITALLFSLVSMTEVTNGQLKSYYLLLACER